MTLHDIEKSNLEFLSPSMIAKVVGCDPHSIRLQARRNPKCLGFPVTVIGNRTRIPRIPFIKYMQGGHSG